MALLGTLIQSSAFSSSFLAQMVFTSPCFDKLVSDMPHQASSNHCSSSDLSVRRKECCRPPDLLRLVVFLCAEHGKHHLICQLHLHPRSNPGLLLRQYLSSGDFVFVSTLLCLRPCVKASSGRENVWSFIRRECFTRFSMHGCSMDMSRANCCEAIFGVLTNTQSNFHRHSRWLYIQQQSFDGLPMGSPASPVIANIYMRVFEEKALSTFPLAKPNVWYRYVDDVFVLKKIHVQNLLDHLNRQHPSSRFTVETEREGKLPHLDLRVSRVDTGAGRLSIEIYRKSTHSSRYLQFSSHHSDNAKSSVARALFERVSYVTGEEKRKRESGTIEEELKLNIIRTR